MAGSSPRSSSRPQLGSAQSWTSWCPERFRRGGWFARSRSASRHFSRIASGGISHEPATMALSVLDIFTIGIGPSSAHTVAPMVAARRFAKALAERDPPARVLVEFRGSLGAVGRSHGADKGVMLGLMGFTPDEVEVSEIARLIEKVRVQGHLVLPDGRSVALDAARDLRFADNRKGAAQPDSMRFTAFGPAGRVILERTFHIVGGGDVIDEEGAEPESMKAPVARPFPFNSANDLLLLCRQQRSTIAELMWGNE